MDKISKFKLIILFLLAVILLGGCSKDDVKDIESLDNLVIEHKLGLTKLKEKPKKVIIFDYGMLDILDNLGLDENIVGLPKSSLPEYLNKYNEEKYKDIGSLQEPNFEEIFEINPDLIIIGDRQADKYEEFNKIAPTLYISVMDGEYMDLLKSNMDIIGNIFNKEKEIKELYSELEEMVENLYAIAKEKGGKSLFLMANDGELSAYGKGSRFRVLFNEFGMDPVDEKIDVSTHGQKINYEYIVQNNPDYIFVMDRGAVVGGDISARDVMENELIKKTDAYKNDKIIYLNSQVWYVSSGGVTSTKKMVDDILKINN